MPYSPDALMPKEGDIGIWVNQGTFLIWFDN